MKLSGDRITNYLTIDVEDYFQVAAFEKEIQPREWDTFESRVVENTHCLLRLLSRFNCKATFFVVGWIAERYPSLIREIHLEGHSIGCHSYLHQKIYTMSPEGFREDTQKAKSILEDIVGDTVFGYRAPSYSITSNSLWALDILEELGFTFDSSIFPIHHDNYGIPDAPRFEYILPGKKLKEYPISTVRFFGKNIPVSGGGYFRLFPYWLTRFFLKRINQVEHKPFMFYLHPWEVDPGQPRMRNISQRSKFRHYNNLDKTSHRLEKLLGDFNFGPVKGL